MKNHYVEKRAPAFFVVMMTGLLAFEIVNFYMTDFGLSDLLGMAFWPQFLAGGMCLADFVVVLVAAVSPEKDTRSYFPLAFSWLLMALAQAAIMAWAMYVWAIEWGGPGDDVSSAVTAALGYLVGRAVLLISVALSGMYLHKPPQAAEQV